MDTITVSQARALMVSIRTLALFLNPYEADAIAKILFSVADRLEREGTE